MNKLKKYCLLFSFLLCSIGLYPQFTIDGSAGYMSFGKETNINDVGYNVNIAYSVTPKYKLALNTIYVPCTREALAQKNVISVALLFSPSNIEPVEKFSFEPALGIEYTSVGAINKSEIKSYFALATNINLLYTLSQRWRIGLKTHTALSKNSRIWAWTYGGIILRYRM